MPQLDPTWFASQIFWLAITFVTLYVVLSRLVLPPLMDVVARRKQTIEGDIGMAQQLKTEAEKARDEYERMAADARSKAQQQVNAALEAGKAAAEKAGKEMDQQIAAKLAEANRKIATKKQELIDNLTPASAELASMIVEKLTQRAPNADQVKRIINDLSKDRT